MQQNTLGVLDKIKNGMFPFLIAFSALSVSASAAFYSVSGLSKLFAGASLEVIIMAGSLEFAKLITASLLYQYWDTINKTLRTYLAVSTVILVLITSMGIYGFLSAAYQETYSKLSVVENQKGFKKKVAPALVGKLQTSDTEIPFSINQNNHSFVLHYQSQWDVWESNIVQLDSQRLILKEGARKYFYQRVRPNPISNE